MEKLVICFIFLTFYYLKCYSSSYTCKPGGYYDYRNNKCVYCKDQGLFLQNGSCVTTCGEFDSVIPKISTCFKCTNNTLLYYREKCVEECPANSIENRREGICEECNWNGTYYFLGNCMTKCPYYTSVDEDEKICINCKSQNKKLYKGNCVDSCPKGSTLYNLTNNLCVECKYQGRVTHGIGTCGEYCINNHLALNENFECTECSQINKIWYNGFCTDSCLAGSISQSSIDCSTCKSKSPSQFYYQANSTSMGYCVESCGKLGADYAMNLCIVDPITYFNFFNQTCKNNATTEIVNSRNMMCHCKNGYSGIYCDANSTIINSLQETMSTFFLFILDIKLNSNFSLKKNPYYSQFLKDFTNIVYNNVQIVYNNSSYSPYDSIQDFTMKYFRSNEIYSFEQQDLFMFYKSYDLLFILNYHLLWAKYQNYTEALNVKKSLSDALKLFNMNVDNFLLNLRSLSKLIFTNPDYYIDRLLGYYGELNSDLKFINAKFFSANVFNLNIMRRKSIQNIQGYTSYFQLNTGCYTENSYFIYNEITPDFTYFYDGAKMRSSYVHIGFYNSTFDQVNLPCSFSVYFPIRDSPLFNFTIPLKNYYNLTDIGIDPFNKDDKYFTDVCYRYPFNNSNIELSRLIRIRDNFLNSTVSCKYKVLNDNSNTEGYCTFAGFQKFSVEKGGGVFLKCICQTHDNNNYYFVTIDNYNFDNLPNTVLNQWFCFKYGFDMTDSFSNPGFIIINFLAIFELTAIIVGNIFLEPNFLTTFKSVRKHDLEYLKYICNYNEKRIEAMIDSYHDEQKRISVLNKRQSLNIKRKSSILFVHDQNDNVKNLKKTLDYYILNSGYADYHLFPMDTLIHIDKRSACKYFFDYIYDYNILSITFFKFSYFLPKNVRILNFFFYVINHIFFIVIMISPEEEGLDIFGNDMFDVCYKLPNIYIYVFLADGNFYILFL
jgi:hypothetical protein